MLQKKKRNDLYAQCGAYQTLLRWIYLIGLKLFFLSRKYGESEGKNNKLKKKFNSFQYQRISIRWCSSTMAKYTRVAHQSLSCIHAWVQGTERYINILTCMCASLHRWRWKSSFFYDCIMRIGLSMTVRLLLSSECMYTLDISLPVCVLLLLLRKKVKKGSCQPYFELTWAHDIKIASLAAQIYGRYMCCLKQKYTSHFVIGSKIQWELRWGINETNTKLTATYMEWLSKVLKIGDNIASRFYWMHS